MKVGDLVHNVSHDRHGMIIGETNHLIDPDDIMVEKVFNILWDDGNIRVVGSTFLRLFCEG
jgi:hypothetical protein